jgi:enoyl-CoA hydratase
MEFNNLLVEISENIATVTVNRPKALNALNEETLKELLCCFQGLESDAEVRAVILTGAGEKAFVAGADIAFMKDLEAVAARDFALLGQKVMNTIEQLAKPVIAAVNGFALGGGCELALACDIRLASDNALFGQPEVNLGVIPGFAGTQQLPRLVGRAGQEILFLATWLLPTGLPHRSGQPGDLPGGAAAGSRSRRRSPARVRWPSPCARTR